MSNPRFATLHAAFFAMMLNSWPSATAADPVPSQASPRPTQPDLADTQFRDKVLVLTTDLQSNMGVTHEKVECRRFAGTTLLVGKGVELSNTTGSYKARTMWFALNHIAVIAEFGSVEEARKAYELVPKPEPAVLP
jgi:hypothetical protein